MDEQRQESFVRIDTLDRPRPPNIAAQKIIHTQLPPVFFFFIQTFRLILSFLCYNNSGGDELATSAPLKLMVIEIFITIFALS